MANHFQMGWPLMDTHLGFGNCCCGAVLGSVGLWLGPRVQFGIWEWEGKQGLAGMQDPISPLLS